MIQQAINRAVGVIVGAKKLHDTEKRSQALQKANEQKLAIEQQKVEVAKLKVKLQKSQLNFQRQKYREGKKDDANTVVLGGQKVKMSELHPNLQKALMEAK